MSLKREFQITDEIRQLGVSGVRVLGKTFFYNSRTEPIHCQYDKNDLSKTINRLRKAFNYTAIFDKEAVEKILVLLSQIWLNWETMNAEAESKERDKRLAFETAAA